MGWPLCARRNGVPRPLVQGLGVGILVLALLVPPFVLGDSSLASRAGSTAPSPTSHVLLVTVAPGLSAKGGIDLLNPLNPSLPMTIVVALTPSDPAGLAKQERLMYGSGPSHSLRPFTPSELSDRFGANATAYQGAESYFVSYGLNVQTSPDRLLLIVSGTSGRVASAFHTQFDTYRTGSRTFFSHSTPATLPANLPWAGVLGLGNETSLRPYADSTARIPILPSATCSATGFLVPCQVETAYAEAPLLAAGKNGTGFRIGVVDRYDGAEPQTTLASDFAGFTTMFSLPGGGVSYLYPVPTSIDLNATSTQWGVEAALDMQWARALAPGAQIDMTFSPDASGGLYAAVDWLVSHRAVNVISLSWGEPDVGVYNSYATACVVACNATSDGSYDILSPVLAEAALEGIGVFAASGDCGAADGTNGVSTNFPASDPSVVSVGGTDLAVSSSGGYQGEVGWSGNQSGSTSPGCQNQGGAGGGYSPFPRPWWQSGPGLPGMPPTRAVPDVSLVAGSPVVIRYRGGNAGVAGTSEASPMWAGMEAVLDQYSGTSLGFLAPSLYQLFQGAQYHSVFHDVISGSNGYAAGTGWDPVTGIGTPVIGSLAADLAASTISPGTLVASLRATPRSGPSPLSANFAASASGGRPPYALYNINFGDGNSSVAPLGSATHVYRFPGVFAATAVAFDSGSNLSIAPPVAVVVGGGSNLNITLNASTTTPSVGSSVSFNTTVRGGTAPYRFYFAFGDGTYLNWSSAATVAHVYANAGGFCASVVVSDSSRPIDGASSNRVSISVGGSGLPACSGVSPLRAAFSSNLIAADAPAEFPLQILANGGVPPYTVEYTSDDPYTAACQCGILRTAGLHQLKIFVNDSSIDSLVLLRNVTVYPALVATFSVSSQSGNAPFRVTFGVNASGGNRTNASFTQWNFGDSSSAVGATATHVYSATGYYLAVGNLMDLGQGNASEAFLIHVGPVSGTGAFVVTASVTAAVRALAGSLVQFRASPSGGTSPYLVRWDLGANDSAFGTSVNQTYNAFGCLALGTCPLAVILRVEQANGIWLNLSLSLSPALSHRSSALVLNDSLPSGVGGAVPWRLAGAASSAGVPTSVIAWQFGDGATATGGSVSHTYSTPGNYTISEIATDRFGDFLERTHAVVVRPAPPLPTVLGGPSVSSGSAPLRVSFFAFASGGSGGPYAYQWTFGDGSSSTGNYANHTYPTPGQYNATVRAADRLGTSALATYLITVYAVTNLTLAVSSSSSSVATGGELELFVQARPHCVPRSVPSCAPSGIILGAYVSPNATPVAVGIFEWGPNLTGIGGFWNFTAHAPSSPGAWWFFVQPLDAGYNGSGAVEVNVTSTELGTVIDPAVVVLLVSTGVAVIAALTIFARSRRRGS